MRLDPRFNPAQIRLMKARKEEDLKEAKKEETQPQPSSSADNKATVAPPNDRLPSLSTTEFLRRRLDWTLNNILIFMPMRLLLM